MALLDPCVECRDELIIVKVLVVSERQRLSDTDLDPGKPDGLGVSRPHSISAIDRHGQERGLGASGQRAEPGL
jgi:hypothetical protein